MEKGFVLEWFMGNMCEVIPAVACFYTAERKSGDWNKGDENVFQLRNN